MNNKKILRLLFYVLGVVIVLPAYAQGQSDLDAILEGFGDQEEVSTRDASSLHEEGDHVDDVLNGFDEQEMSLGETEDFELTERAQFWDLRGYWKFLTVMNVNNTQEQPFQGFTHLRGELGLKFDLDLPATWKVRIGANFRHDVVYLLKGRDDYSEDLLDDHETEIEFREAYLQGNLTQHLDLKFGRQIVVWGVSESLRVVDVLNPLDQREIGMVDIEDLRLPVMMSRLDYYPASRWTLTGIMIHETRFHKEPPFGSDFYPGTEPLPDEKEMSDFSLASQEFALAASGRFTGWDVSLHVAWVYDDNWHVEEITEYDVQRKHNRLFIGGLSGQIALGNSLFKGEAAFIDGLKFSSLPDREKSRLDLLAGLEYSGFHNTTISLEIVNRYLFEYDKTLSSEDIQRNQFQTAFRFTRDFYNDTMHVMLVASALGVQGEGGTLERVQLEYEWMEALSIFLGATLYQSGDTEFSKAIQDNDRVFLEFKYSF